MVCRGFDRDRPYAGGASSLLRRWMGLPEGTPRRDRWDRWKVEYLAVENREGAYGELLANIRRLTVMVLDDLEEGSRLRTLDQRQRRLALRDGGSRIDGLVSETGERRRKGVVG